MLRFVLLAVFLCTASASRSNTNGHKGEMCGPGPNGNFRRCPSPHVCVDGNCQCPPGTVGVGGLSCHSTNQTGTDIYNDPKIYTWGNREKSDLPLPCQSLYAHFKTDLKPGQPNGKCEVQVHTAIFRGKGKMFLGGFMVSIGTNLNNAPKILIKAYGMNNNGSYQFDVQYKLPESNDVNWRDTMKGPQFGPYEALLDEELDTDSNKYAVASRKCGFYISFRPANPWAGLDQEFVPGLAINIDKDHNPVYLSRHLTIALAEGDYFSSASATRSSMDELIVRASSTTVAVSDFPYVSSDCFRVKEAFDSCAENDIDTALDHCRFILHHEKFVKCFSEAQSGQSANNSDRVLALYSLCLRASCSASTGACRDIHNALLNVAPECRTHAPGDMLSGSCEFNAE